MFRTAPFERTNDGYPLIIALEIDKHHNKKKSGYNYFIGGSPLATFIRLILCPFGVLSNSFVIG